jgi:hypothetical protein
MIISKAGHEYKLSVRSGAMDEKHEVIMDACLALSDEGREASAEIIRKRYPFNPQARPRPLRVDHQHR